MRMAVMMMMIELMILSDIEELTENGRLGMNG